MEEDAAMRAAVDAVDTIHIDLVALSEDTAAARAEEISFTLPLECC